MMYRSPAIRQLLTTVELQPISFMFVAAGLGQLGRMQFARFNLTQKENETNTQTAPITDISYWGGRYVLTQLTLKKEDGKVLVINDALVTIFLTKTIVKTSLTGLNGTIKEYIGNNDFEIKISVGIVATDENGNIVDKYPVEGVTAVHEFLNENSALEIQSTFLDMFKINRIVVEKYNLTQATDSNRQELKIDAISDDDYVIKNTVY